LAVGTLSPGSIVFPGVFMSGSVSTELTVTGEVDTGAAGSVELGGALSIETSVAGTVLAATVLSGAASIESLTLAGTTVSGGDPELDFTGFTKWDVLRGSIDLVGDGWNYDIADVRPGNGMYIDLVGTSGDGTTTAAKIRTKQSFTFQAGRQYRLRFYYCQYVDWFEFSVPPYNAPFWVDVSIGDAGEVVAPTRFNGTNDVFILGEIEWTQGSTATGKIIFDHQDESMSAEGILIDRVKLEDITAGEEMFYDNFDHENPS
jgi:hypothetical protein